MGICSGTQQIQGSKSHISVGHPSLIIQTTHDQIPSNRNSSGVDQQVQDQNGNNNLLEVCRIQQQYYCNKCKILINEDLFQVGCQRKHCYHLNCIQEIFNKQIKNGKQFIKCECGTKVSASLLKQHDQFQMEMQTELFRNQLQILLQTSIVRHLDNHKQIQDQFEDYNGIIDYYITHNDIQTFLIKDSTE